MAGKDDPLRQALASCSGAVTLSFSHVDQLVGGLPPSARRDRPWWANWWRLEQAQSWLSAGFSVGAVDLSGGTVTFVPGAPPRPSSTVTRRAGRLAGGVVLDGVHQLEELLRRAGYRSVAAAVAEHAAFLHRDTMHQTHGQAVFPTIRDMLGRGVLDTLPDGRRVLRDDNTSPTLAFLWAAGRSKGPDVQYNHVWNDSANPDAYTALWNLCATPAFLAKTTDGSNHPDVVAVLRYRAWDPSTTPSGRAHPAGAANRLRPTRVGPAPACARRPPSDTPSPPAHQPQEPARDRGAHHRLALQRLATRPHHLTPTLPAGPSTSPRESGLDRRLRPLRTTRDDHRHACRSPLRGVLRRARPGPARIL